MNNVRENIRDVANIHERYSRRITLNAVTGMGLFGMERATSGK
ncbi:hypothetical protein HMPREF1587_00359 [Bifidobacterium breve JCP7499]|nr:hypothetical protein HMPREF1587_00359 [Bifidobacterium breve JCP7499]